MTISLFLLHVGLYDLVAIHCEIKRCRQITGLISCDEILLRVLAVKLLTGILSYEAYSESNYRYAIKKTKIYF